MIKKIKLQGKEKSKGPFAFKDSRRSDPLEASLSDEDIEVEEEEEPIEEIDQNDDESLKSDDIYVEDFQNIELPQRREKKKVVIALLKGEQFMTISYGFKGYSYDQRTIKSFYKKNAYLNISKMSKIIQNYANGFYEFEEIKIANFFKKFKSEALLVTLEKNKEDKNKTNRHFLNYYIKFWDGTDVKLSCLTFDGRPNYRDLALTIFRVGIGNSLELKKRFEELSSKNLKGRKLLKTNEISDIMDDIFKNGEGAESGMDKNKFFSYLNQNQDFLKIIDHLGDSHGKN